MSGQRTHLERGGFFFYFKTEEFDFMLMKFYIDMRIHR